MDFTYRYLYLILGLALFGGAVPVLLNALRGERESTQADPGQRLIIALIALTLGGILLRLSWVMFMGPGRSEVF